MTAAPDLVHISGYATRYGVSYPVLGGAAGGGWDETVAAGAAARAVAAGDDTRLLINHSGVPLARTKSGTLELTSDAAGLRVDASLDRRDSTAASLAVALERGDLDQMSFAFRVTGQRWSDDYTQRTIFDLDLFDVSAVSFPASPTTSIGIVASAGAGDGQRGKRAKAEPRPTALADARRLIAGAA